MFKNIPQQQRENLRSKNASSRIAGNRCSSISMQLQQCLSDSQSIGQRRGRVISAWTFMCSMTKLKRTRQGNLLASQRSETFRFFRKNSLFACSQALLEQYSHVQFFPFSRSSYGTRLLLVITVLLDQI